MAVTISHIRQLVEVNSDYFPPFIHQITLHAIDKVHTMEIGENELDWCRVFYQFVIWIRCGFNSPHSDLMRLIAAIQSIDIDRQIENEILSRLSTHEQYIGEGALSVCEGLGEFGEGMG